MWLPLHLIKSLANLMPSEPCTTICRCMKLNRDFSRAWVLGGLIFALGMLAPKARANIYATNLRIDGGTTNIAVNPGTNISISFRLNEPASLGTIVQIRSGASVVSSLFFAAAGLRGYECLIR